jgi:hypothetical protein
MPVNNYGYGTPGMRTFGIDAFDFNGRSDTDVTYTGNYADNAMGDDSKINEDDESGTLDILHGILNQAGITDDEIIAGIRFKPVGLRKLSIKTSVPVSDLPRLLVALGEQLNSDPQHLSEDDERFVKEEDYLGNVTVRDTQTGREVTLTGTQAAEILKRIDRGENEQDVLAGCSSLMEDASTDILREETMPYEGGTYNFPWMIDGRHGTATAAFDGEGNDFRIKIIDVRDDNGVSVKVGSAMLTQMKRDAIYFIGKE